jgi:23S rRNA pseudouridine2604 synthase
MHINSFLVKQLKLSNQQIKSDIASGHVLIDHKLAVQKQAVSSVHTISYKSKIIQQGKQLFYYAYYKPVGVESTLNTTIPNNLIEATGIQDYFFPIGRLDKASEGLMILTNDGQLYKQIVAIDNAIEKIYEVVVDKEINKEFISRMEKGIVIMGSLTIPCKMNLLEKFKFRITLIEGRNRQIRRMCYKLGCNVLSLKRITIGKLNLGNSAPNTHTRITKESIIALSDYNEQELY